MLGFSQAFMPAYLAWGRAMETYKTARTISFVAQSFRNECAKSDRNIERWKKTVSVAKELEHCEFFEYRQGDTLRAIKASCVISGEIVEIIGLCTP